MSHARGEIGCGNSEGQEIVAYVIDWGTAPDWVVATTAVVGAFLAVRQLSALKKTEQQAADAHDAQVQIARATLIREIDRDFDSPPILASRQKLLALRNRFEAELEKKVPPMIHVQQILESARLVSDYVSKLWTESRTFDGDKTADKDNSADEYSLIMRLPLWCETVGHLCQRNLAPLDDILDLYDQVFIMTIGNLADHIRLRQEAPPHKNRRYLENAMYLYNEASKFKAARDAPVSAPPAKAATQWKR